MRAQYHPHRANRVVGRVVVAAAAVFGLLAMLAAADEPQSQKPALRGPEKMLPFSQPHHPYDPSAPELLLPLRPGLRQWTPKDIEAEIRARVDFEKRRPELDIYYYRIGYTLAYPLPLTASPQMSDLPIGIRGITYPWYTWLSWALEERWRLFHAAWRRLGDRDAGRLLQTELAALAGWGQSCEVPGSASLGSAHIAGCLAQALSVREGWELGLYEKARSAAETMLERDVWPWFQKEWPGGRELATRDLQNIRVITLARSAELARVVGSPRAAALETRLREALRAWFRFRTGQPPYNEGSAYDGFLMDSLTGWLSGEPDRETLLTEGRNAFGSQAWQWIQLALPGRVDVQAPLGDVEPEMPFWMNALGRLALWYRSPEYSWAVRCLPVIAMPAGLLSDILERGDSVNARAAWSGRLAELPHAVTLGSGWDAPDILVAAGLTRGETGHLHSDAGQIVLGWQGRFWITDPGYQQYRPGAEREFSVGVNAHNIPVIAGKAPTKRLPRLVSTNGSAAGGASAVIDLSSCYEGLPEGASIVREIRVLYGAQPAIIVRDRLKNVGPGAEVQTAWLGGTHLSWAFREGWGRLSDGEHALWIGVSPGNISAAGLDRHEGSRGPLTIHDKTTLADGSGDRYWIFACDPDGAWVPPGDRFREFIRQWDIGAVMTNAGY